MMHSSHNHQSLSSESKLKAANRLMQLQCYEQAEELYREWKDHNPKISKIVDANLTICEGKISTPRPKVSLIIPCHNVAPYLEKCLHSAINQSLREIEIIAVNDGSTDDTLQILQKFANDDLRINIISTKLPSGNSGTPRNIALKIARGDFVAFLDADDWIDHTAIENLYLEAKLSGADIVGSKAFYRVTADGDEELVEMSNTEFDPNKDQTRKHLFVSPHFTIVWHRIYARALIQKYNIKFAETSTSADTPFSFIALALARKIRTIEGAYYHYRFDRPGSTVERRKGKQAFALLDSYEYLINRLEQLKLENLAPYAIHKLLGDYDYNRKLISETLSSEFSERVLSFAHRTISRFESQDIFSKYKASLLEKGKFYSEKSLYRSTQDKPDSILLSIIIPAHNVSEYVRDCLSSLLKLTGRAFEIIIVNDGSNDGTQSIIDDLAKNHSEIIPFQIRNSTGNPGTPRNIGITASKGKYIAFVDADDWIESNALQDILLRLTRLDADILASTSFIKHTRSVSIMREISPVRYEIGEDLEKALSSAYFSNVWHRLYKRSFLDQKNIYFPSMYLAEDMCFSTNAHLKASTIQVYEGCFYNYRYQRPHSTTDYRQGQKALDIARDIPRIIEYFDFYNISSDAQKIIEAKYISSLLYTINKTDTETGLKLIEATTIINKYYSFPSTIAHHRGFLQKKEEYALRSTK